MIDFRDIDRPSVWTAKAKIAGFGTQNVHFPQHLPGGRKFYDCAFAVARDVKIAIHIAAHSIKTVSVEFFQQPFVGELPA